MPFSPKDADKALVSCGRSCCLCHKFCGTNIELHHILPQSEGGLDTFDNCIPLCFDCHAEVQHYNPQHPKGRKFSGDELKAHRDMWYEKVAASGSLAVSAEHCEMDRTIFSKIREMLPSDGETIYFLKDTDLAYAFELELLKGLHKFVSFCELPEAEFMDAELESLRANLHCSVSAFLFEVAQNTFPCAGLPRRNEIPPEWRDTQPIEYQKVRANLNDLATTVYQRYQELMRSGRRRLAVS